MVQSSTPASLGYRLPAEWEPHAATWLGWPHNRTDWPGKFEPIPWVYAEIVRNLARHERIEILVQNADAEKQARRILHRADALGDNVRFHRFPTDRGWTRDFCPIFLKRDHRRDPIALVNWQFNAWAKYSDWTKDDRASEQIVRSLKFPVWRPVAAAVSPARSRVSQRRIVLEGGSIDVNGRGLLLTTEECLLSPVQQRNPGLSREDLERLLCDYLGLDKIIWLERGIVGDDTHGHVDDIARFVAPNTVVTAVEPNRHDPNHAPLKANLELLRRTTNQQGRPLRVVDLPMPKPVIFEGQRLPASYANFYIANRVVLVPAFNDPNDRTALNILSEVFPGREVVPIYCRDLVWGLGTIHCMTMQQPQ